MRETAGVRWPGRRASARLTERSVCASTLLVLDVDANPDLVGPSGPPSYSRVAANGAAQGGRGYDHRGPRHDQPRYNDRRPPPPPQQQQRYRDDGYRPEGYRSDGYRGDGYRQDGYRGDGYRRDGGYRGGPRGGGHGYGPRPGGPRPAGIAVPKEAYDFEAANANFVKEPAPEAAAAATAGTDVRGAPAG